MVPVAVRDHFLDEKAQPDKSGTLFPQPTHCLMEEGDITITMVSAKLRGCFEPET